MKMQLGLVSSTLLYLAAWTGNVYSTHGPLKSCCSELRGTKVPVDRVVDYQSSASSCRINAIVFTTESGKRICADPSGAWTRRAMDKVNADRRAALQVEKKAVAAGGGASTVEEGSGNPGRRLTNRRRKCGRRGTFCGRRMQVLPTETVAA